MELSQFLSIVWARRYWAILVFVCVVVSALAVTLILPKQYTADAEIALDVKATDPVSGMPVQGYLAPSFMTTQVDIIQSYSTALKVVEMNGLAESAEIQEQWRQSTDGKGDLRNWVAASLLKKLSVQPSRDSNVITLQYDAGSPAFAAEITNSFTKAYIQNIADMKMSAAAQNYKFFEVQLKGLKKKLEDAQQVLSEYQQSQGIVANDERLDIETQRLNELSAQLAAMQGATVDARSRTLGGEGAPDVLNNPAVQQQRAQVVQLEVALRQISEKDGPNHPRYLQASAQLEASKKELTSLLAQYAGGLNTAARNANSRQSSLGSELEAQKQRVLQLKTQRARLGVLQGEVESAQRTYDAALQRLSQTALESQSSQTNVLVLKSAIEPATHSSPNTLLNLILAIFVGAVLGVVVALVKELLDRKVRSAADLEQILDLPVLAAISAQRPARVASELVKA
ncbi:chain length determinant protein EpsF [Chitinolyticbacter albus]|uniref:chain length determinant protein EpsF n=1 Tax=Chitinolyticbacter albus TaxID=2961951 RepID=UPI00210E8725|nr:chain length determinant protein EpsF [Chitinolyticbacter albus]